MRILLLSLGILFASELEVQGDLKVSGNIDAQNNPVKNVGTPQSLTDAINGNVLQDALRDDANYEYKIVVTKIDNNWLYPSNETFKVSYKQIGDNQWQSDFENLMNTLMTDGWKIFQMSPYVWENYTGSFYWNKYIFKRPIEE